MEETVRTAPVNDENLSLKELIDKLVRGYSYLKTKWLIIVGFILLGLLLGFLYSLRQKTSYEAVITFALQDDQSPSGMSAYSGLASQLGADFSLTSEGPFEKSNILELIASRTVIDKTLLSPVIFNGKNESVAEAYIQINNMRDLWKKSQQLNNINFPANTNPDSLTLTQDSVIKSFYQDITKNYLTVGKVENAGSILSITVRSYNQLFAKTFAETLVKVVSDFYIQTKTKKTTENIKILQKQTDSVRNDLNAAIHGVAQSNDVNPNANPNMQVLHTGAQRRSFDVQVDQTMLAELIRNLEMSKVTLRKERPLIQIIDKPRLPLDAKKPGKLKSMLIGGFVFGALITVFLLLKRFLSKVMA